MKKSKALLLPLALSLLLAGCADSTGNSSESASQESSETSASSSESSTSETSASSSGSSTSETSGSPSSSSDSVIEEITVSITDSKGNSSGTAYVGDTVTLTVKVTGAEGKTVAWSSDHTDIATVSDAGVVTAIKAGTATISATVEGVTATYSLTVENVPVAGIAINNKATCPKLRPNKTYQLSATVTPENAFDKTITWESGDATIATVDNTGLVTALKAGKVKITAKAGDCSDFVEITILEELTISVVDAKDAKTGTAYVGDTVTLTAKVTGLDGETITWSSSNTEVATVSDNGVVTAVKAGSATISATVEDVTATYSLTVQNVLVTGISISNKESCSSMKLHEKVQLTATITPENATDKTVTWESSDATVASVDATGLVTAIKQGTAKITAKADSYSDTVEITVTEPTINAAQSGLPESYKVSTSRDYQVDVTHTGTISDPLDFKTDHSVNVSYSDAQLSIPVMSMPIDNNYNYLKFVVETSGTYYLFSRYDAKANPSLDPDLYGIYKDYVDSSDKNKLSNSSNFTYASTDSIATKYATGGKAFFLSIQLDAGTYVAKLGKAVAEYEMGIVSVSEKADSGYEVVSATSNPDKKTVTDHYSMEFVKDTALFSSSMNIGYCAVDGDLHQFYYKEEDNEYLYVDEKEEIAVSDMNSFFSWETLLSDKAFKYEGVATAVSEDDSKTINMFKANLADVDNGSGLKLFLSGLGVSEYAQTFTVTTDVETGKVFGLALVYKDGSTVNVGVETITDLSITVTHHDVNNDGAAGEDSGITQEW